LNSYITLVSDRDQDTSTVEQDLQAVLVEACELANSRTAKVLSARYTGQAVPDAQVFMDVVVPTRDFIVQTEILAGQMIAPLRAVLTNQVRAANQVYLPLYD
jgi:hypothetical protein